ncbi:MAG: restriction endonuclease subunit S [Acidimicrobiia bacterium]|nr:restriction endonuclease subunit S [Acidimicrobiia bacterium]
MSEGLALPSGWRTRTIGEATVLESKRVGSKVDPLVFSSTKHYGLVPSDEYFKGRQIYSENLAQYRVVEPGWFAYATNHLAEGSIGLNQGLGEGCVSPMYTVFSASDSIDPRYLLRVLKSPEALAAYAVLEQASVDRRGSIRYRQFAEITFRAPPLEEQKRIAEVLDTIDEAIQATERLIAKLTQLEQGFRRDLMNGVGSCTRGEWRECRVGSFARVQRGASPRPIDNPAWFSESGRAWVRISDVTSSGDLLVGTRDKLSNAGAARSRWVNPGDVIMSIAATIGVAIVVGTEACIHDGFVHVQHDDSVDNDFLVLLLEHYRDDFIRRGQTGTQSNINSAIVADTTVLVPPIDEQRRIVSFARSARANIRRNQDFKRTLRAIRSGLASDLLSGRVRTVAS